MKKFLSVIVSAVIGASTLTCFPAVAEDTKAAQSSKGGVVVFGDSIAAGYGLSEKEHNYGEIIGDYLDCDVANYAHSGDTSFDLLEKIDAMTDEQKKKVENSDYIIISIGGNDIMGYAAKKILNFAAKKDLLNDGFTASDIPENPSITDLLVMANLRGEGGFMDYASSGMTAVMELTALLTDITSNLRIYNTKYEGYISEVIMRNITSAAIKLRRMNKNAKIIVQTIYQPLQFDPNYIEEEYGMDSDYGNLLTLLWSNFKKIMDTFRTELEAQHDIEVVDIYKEFTAVPDGEKQNMYNPGYTYMLVNIQEHGSAQDIHPNQRGHLVIASSILEHIGELHVDNDGLLTQVFCQMAPYSSEYRLPLLTMDTFKRVAGNIMLGDVDFSGDVDGSDASFVLRDYARIGGGMKTLLSNIQNDCSDINTDGAVDGSDAGTILRYYALHASGMFDGTFEEFAKSGADKN